MRTILKKIFCFEDHRALHTQVAFIAIRVMSTPCWCLLAMLAFILYKNLSLTPLQITLIIALKPTSSLLSPYWSQAIYKRPDRIIGNLMGANLFRHLPFLFAPWIASPWFYIFSFGLYMTLTRATIPAWMELFKYHLPAKRREEMVGYGTSIDYLGAAVLTIGMGVLLDRDPSCWRWLFAISSAFGMASTLFLFRDSLRHSLSAQDGEATIKVQEKVVRPWRQVWHLLRERKDFALFQVGFMLGGAGLMIMQPALPKLFIDTLRLSFTEMGIAIALCKGVGAALTSSLWIRLFRKSNLFQLSALVTFFATLFPFFLLATKFHIALLYFAYIFYGIFSAG